MRRIGEEDLGIGLNLVTTVEEMRTILLFQRVSFNAHHASSFQWHVACSNDIYNCLQNATRRWKNIKFLII